MGEESEGETEEEMKGGTQGDGETGGETNKKIGQGKEDESESESDEMGKGGRILEGIRQGGGHTGQDAFPMAQRNFGRGLVVSLDLVKMKRRVI
jgi:hypothetical protein